MMLLLGLSLVQSQEVGAVEGRVGALDRSERRCVAVRVAGVLLNRVVNEIRNPDVILSVRDDAVSVGETGYRRYRCNIAACTASKDEDSHAFIGNEQAPLVIESQSEGSDQAGVAPRN